MDQLHAKHQENMSMKCIPLLYRKTGVYLFFLFLLQNIDCGYSLEPPHQSNMYPQSIFGAKIRKISFFFSAENFQFLKLKKSLFIAWASFRNGK